MTTTITSRFLNNGARERAVRSLKQWIRDGRLPRGGRLPAENTLASQLEISRSTVRLALKDLEDGGLIRSEGRNRLVSDSADAVESIIAESIGLLATSPVPTSARAQRMGTDIFVHVGAIEAIHHAGLNAISLNAEHISDKRVHRLISQQPRGLIALHQALNQLASRAAVEHMIDSGVPAVAYGTPPSSLAIDAVVSDHDAGSYRLTQWLIEQGRKRILRFWFRRTETDQRARPHWLDARDTGYNRAVNDAGLEPLPAVEAVQADRGDMSDQAWFELNKRSAMGYLLEAVRELQCDAILCVSDGLVPPTAAALRLLGKEPNRDVWVAGYDNYWSDSPERQWEPTIPVGTVDKQNVEIGRALVGTLLKRAAGRLPDEPQVFKVMPRLVINQIGAG